MRKSLFAFVVLAFVAMAVPVSAQAIRYGYIPQTPDGWYYKIQGDQVGMLTADNLGMVRGLTNQLRQSEIRSLADNLMWNGAAYGINTGRGFYPMYDQNRQPLSGRQRIERGAGIVAAADGVRRIINNPRGAAGWIEAAVGAVMVNDSRYRGQPKNQRDNGTVVTPPAQGRGDVRVGPDGIPVAVGTRPAGAMQVVEPSQPAWKVFRNRFENLEVRIHVVGENLEEYISVPAGGEVSKELPGDTKIWAEVMVWKGSRQVPTQELGQRELPYHSGWVFFNPAKGEL